MTRIMVFGTFDLLHEGHKNFLSQAKKLGGHLTVVVSTDNNVRKSKGSLPIKDENERLENVKNLDMADNTIPGREDHDFMKTIREHSPDIICLGYDQKSFGVVEKISRFGLNIKVTRLQPFKEKQYKTSILKNMLD